MNSGVATPTKASKLAHRYEIEIKSLLGEAQKSDALRFNMLKVDPHTKLTSKSTQLNHYFQGDTLEALLDSLAYHLSPEKSLYFEDIAKKAKAFSLRTRQKDTAVYFIVKASVDDGTSANAVSRIEFEEPIPVSLEELDALVLGSGFTYQAKWSRQREEFSCKDTTICLDKNAGYGWLAEFEKMVHDESEIAAARAGIQALMKELDVEELPQDRLERMFAHYNAHWREYYGTDKMFTIA